MGFLNSAFLYFLGFASIPVIIHILNRQRYKRINWAAMEFLRLALQKVRRRVLLEELLLLLIRTLIVVLLVGAFAKPYIKSPNLPLLATESKYYIFILDSTLSMNLAVGGISNFQKAKESLINYVDTISHNPKNKVSIILFKKPIENLVREPISDFERVKQLLTEISISKTSGNIKQLFSQIEELVTDEKTADMRKEIYFLTDLQSYHWIKVLEDIEFKESIENMFKSNARLTIVDYGVEEYNNVTITKLFSNNRIVFKNVNNQFVISVKNNSLKSTQIIKLDVFANKLKIGEKNITLPPLASDNITVNYSATTSGPHYLQAKISEDDLSEDNTYNYVFNVPEKINIMVVNGNPSVNVFDDEAFFLTRLINPCQKLELLEEKKECEKNINRPYEYEIKLADELETAVLSSYDLVIIANMDVITSKSLENLEKYLKDGGVLIFFLGNKVQSASYNAFLFKDNGYIMPCQLEEKIDFSDKSSSKGEFVRISDIDLFHPMIIPNKDLFKKYLPNLRFDGFWRIKCLSEKEKITFRKLLSLNDKEQTPLLFESFYENGTILWFNSTASGSDTSWSKELYREIGCSLLHRMIEYGISKKSENFNVYIGDSFHYLLKSETILGTLKVKTPSNSQTTITPIPIDHTTKTYLIKVEENANEGLKEQGIYEVVSTSEANPVSFLVGVNVEPQEGELQKISKEDLKKVNEKISIVDNFLSTSPSDDINKGLHTKIIKMLLYTVIFLLFLEILLAHIFNLGRV